MQDVRPPLFATQSALADEVADLTMRLCVVRRELAQVGAGPSKELTPGSNGDHDGDADIRAAVANGLIEPKLKTALVGLATLHCNTVLTRTGLDLQRQIA